MRVAVGGFRFAVGVGSGIGFGIGETVEAEPALDAEEDEGGRGG